MVYFSCSWGCTGYYNELLIHVFQSVSFILGMWGLACMLIHLFLIIKYYFIWFPIFIELC